MAKIKVYFRRMMLAAPVVSIVGAAFYPMDAWVRQALVLFSLLWFNMFILFDH